ncbi:hypothetical protein OJE16_17530 [Pantoea tagorei]
MKKKVLVLFLAAAPLFSFAATRSCSDKITALEKKNGAGQKNIITVPNFPGLISPGIR